MVRATGEVTVSVDDADEERRETMRIAIEKEARCFSRRKKSYYYMATVPDEERRETMRIAIEKEARCLGTEGKTRNGKRSEGILTSAGGKRAEVRER